MFTELDWILFPDDCEIVEIPSHNQKVFLIEKNGSSSLRKAAYHLRLNILKNQELFDLDKVDVYIRNPRDRYVSGVKTYLEHLHRDHPKLDQNTAKWFVKEYPFLNRHYLPQFHWLLNLRRFINGNCQIRFHDFNDFGNITSVHENASIIDSTLTQELLSQTNIELWIYLDQILLDLAGNSMTWEMLVDHYRKNYSEVYKLVIQRSNLISLV